ncbi:hypothetical protein SEA_PUPPER_121 [Gordonia phage Pupper]|uniref:Uncharacterized protein n=1 Tax=Gordonia phage Pupper TaxID=2571249 RepID=A0A4Y6EKN9_9CAUD|nr:hypothetical protein KHQ83_gp156 [Gordonia phage Pupper]QDF18607.1 hypothetical protein SEA_PUPPER_121 [Gordonia phage Pupper]
MADYAANCPISWPINVGQTPEVSFNGISWNDDFGFFYEAQGEQETFELPTLAQRQRARRGLPN